MMKLGFSINQHDNEGDVFDKCILIHINSTTILRFENYEQYEKFVENLNNMKPEIKNNL